MSSRPPRPWDGPDWQKLWFATQRRSWTSLAVVPSGDGMSTSSLEVATALAEIGWIHLGMPIHVTDARELDIGGIEACLSDTRSRIKIGERVILAVSPVRDNAAAVRVAQAADAAILCVLLGRSEVAAAESTIEQIGRSAFLGSVILWDS